jgi:glycosyltransferase involved in cell wall biosynthesis
MIEDRAMTPAQANKDRGPTDPWEASHRFLPEIIGREGLKVGAEIGVAYGAHCEAILEHTSVSRLYGVDSYTHRADYDDPMNLPQPEFDLLCEKTRKRLEPFGERFTLVRQDSRSAAGSVPDELDFVYIDADHSYGGVFNDLCAWFRKVRPGGIVAGHDYGHRNFQGVKRAVDQFFRRFGWSINLEEEGFWWVRKEPLNISFIMPAYNCSETVEEAVESIFRGNLLPGGEVIIANDCSTDGTDAVLEQLASTHPEITVLTHDENRGGGAARNTAVSAARHPVIFCLDSDNVLVPESVPQLLRHLIDTGSDVSSFGEVRYFRRSDPEITHKWVFKSITYTLAECLANKRVPGASGNYIFTRESWDRAGGYPEAAGALDAWGFGLRQVATGSKMTVLEGTGYLHRHGYPSYWVRDRHKGDLDLKAYSILQPFLHLLKDADAVYVQSAKGRRRWFTDLEKRPLHLKGAPPTPLAKRVERALRKRLVKPVTGYLSRKIKKLKRKLERKKS